MKKKYPLFPCVAKLAFEARQLRKRYYPCWCEDWTFPSLGCSWTSTGNPSKIRNFPSVLSMSFLRPSFKQYLHSPIRYEDVEIWTMRSCLGSSLFQWHVDYAERGKDMGEWQGIRVRRKENGSSNGSTRREQTFHSCFRYLMKAQAATMVRANTGTSTRAIGIPLGSPSLRCPIGPFCTCNLCCTLRDTA